ncbi:hypothetical protein B566_EDAN013600 [Ephemera danica]|nr:hypothetical protein B566_EDAN013600 [Ephemera danica]
MNLTSRFVRLLGTIKSRTYSSGSSVVTCIERLTKRSLLRVSGNEAAPFLQGLITNDMRHLEEGSPAMFCVFLNTKGRVLYDSIVYHPPRENDVFYVECDADASPALQRHLKLYRVRKKIDIEDIGNTNTIWVAYGETGIESKNDDLFIVRDPRLKDLGYRIIAPTTIDVVSDLGGKISNDYENMRYRLGVGEGTEELPPGNCFPLEVNCDYLHGVSFHKGCYIGQELTARTHHTGVVRKRLMPLQYERCQDLPQPDSIVLGPGERNVGKVRKLNAQGHGLALLRVAEVLKSPDDLLVGTLQVKTQRPSWWPAEVSKDRPSG